METILYDTIGTSYNSTRKADPYLVQRLYELLQPSKEKIYLDIGCGTGNYTKALAERGIKFFGIDPSEEMLEKARKNSSAVTWICGSAENIPFEENFFDSGIATLTLHHWRDLKKSFKEIFRVLKPKSRFVIFTSWPEQTDSYWLKHYFPQMMRDSVALLPSLEKISSAIENLFEIITQEKYFVRDDLQDLFLYSGKNRPELYLDENVRRGISSFAAYSNRDEVEAGLKKLAEDIRSGEIENIRMSYENDLGDYSFIVMEKK